MTLTLNNKSKEIRDYIIEDLPNWINTPADELHHNLFNVDYYLVYTHECKDWLKGFTFDAIQTVKEYEQDNFGECSTDLSDPCKVVNMYVYIIGESILQEADIHDFDDLNDESIPLLLENLGGE